MLRHEQLGQLHRCRRHDCDRTCQVRRGGRQRGPGDAPCCASFRITGLPASEALHWNTSGHWERALAGQHGRRRSPVATVVARVCERPAAGHREGRVPGSSRRCRQARPQIVVPAGWYTAAATQPSLNRGRWYSSPRFVVHRLAAPNTQTGSRAVIGARRLSAPRLRMRSHAKAEWGPAIRLWRL